LHFLFGGRACRRPRASQGTKVATHDRGSSAQPATESCSGPGSRAEVPSAGPMRSRISGSGSKSFEVLIEEVNREGRRSHTPQIELSLRTGLPRALHWLGAVLRLGAGSTRRSRRG